MSGDIRVLVVALTFCAISCAPGGTVSIDYQIRLGICNIRIGSQKVEGRAITPEFGSMRLAEGRHKVEWECAGQQCEVEIDVQDGDNYLEFEGGPPWLEPGGNITVVGQVKRLAK